MLPGKTGIHSVQEPVLFYRHIQQDAEECCDGAHGLYLQGSRKRNHSNPCNRYDHSAILPFPLDIPLVAGGDIPLAGLRTIPGLQRTGESFPSVLAATLEALLRTTVFSPLILASFESCTEIRLLLVLAGCAAGLACLTACFAAETPDIGHMLAILADSLSSLAAGDPGLIGSELVCRTQFVRSLAPLACDLPLLIGVH